MDASFIQMLQGIDWSKQTAKEAMELRSALQRAIAESDAWFVQLNNAFMRHPAPQSRQLAIPAGVSSISSPAAPKAKRTSKGAKLRRPSEAAIPPKRGRGRPRKVIPEVDKGPVDVEDHSNPLPIGVLNGSSFLPPGDRPTEFAQLPPGHPRAGGGTYS